MGNSTSKKPVRGRAPKDNGRKIKKKGNLLAAEKIEYIDYKDINLLQRFMSDRSKIKAKAAGTEGRLFGSVTAADVVAAVLAQTGIELDRKKLSVPDHIKTVGEYSVTAKLHNDVQFGININVVAK